MPTENVNDILEDIRIRCELPAYGADTYITTASVERMLSQSALTLTGIVCDAFGDDYLSKLSTVTTLIGVSNVELPDDFYKLRRIQWVQSPTQIWALDRADVDSFEYGYTQPANGWGNIRPIYRLYGDSVLFWPLPDNIYNVQLFYVGRIPALASGGTVSLQSGWSEWLVLDVSAKIRERENKPEIIDRLLAKQQMVEKQIRESAPARDQWKPSQPRDLWQQYDGGGLDPRSLFVRR